MVVKLKPSYLAFSSVLILGLMYKLCLPSTPHGTVSSYVQPLFYLFILIALSSVLFISKKIKFEKSEREFILLLMLYYFVIFLSTFINILYGENNFSISDIFRFILIVAISFSGLCFGKFLNNKNVLKAYLGVVFFVFLGALVFKALYENGYSELIDKRPFTLQNSVLSLIFLYYLSNIRSQLFSLLVILILFVMFFYSGSRSVLVSAIMVLSLYLLKAYRGKHKLLLWVLLATLSVLLSYIFISFIEIFGRFSSLLLVSEDSRFLVWEVIYRDISSPSFNWVTGRGFIDNLYFFYYDSKVVAVNTPHNTYLYLLYYTGIVGLVLGLSIIFFSGRNVDLVFKAYLYVSLGVMLFNDSLFFPHSFSYIVDYWFFYFFLFYFWRKKEC